MTAKRRKGIKTPDNDSADRMFSPPPEIPPKALAARVKLLEKDVEYLKAQLSMQQPQKARISAGVPIYGEGCWKD